MHDPQQERDFYRCLVSDASSRALLKIRDILADDALDDPACFQRIEAIVSPLEDLASAAAAATISDEKREPCGSLFYCSSCSSS